MCLEPSFLRATILSYFQHINLRTRVEAESLFSEHPVYEWCTFIMAAPRVTELLNSVDTSGIDISQLCLMSHVAVTDQELQLRHAADTSSHIDPAKSCSVVDGGQSPGQRPVTCMIPCWTTSNRHVCYMNEQAFLSLCFGHECQTVDLAARGEHFGLRFQSPGKSHG